MPGSQFESCFRISAADGLTRIWAMESEISKWRTDYMVWGRGEGEEGLKREFQASLIRGATSQGKEP